MSCCKNRIYVHMFMNVLKHMSILVLCIMMEYCYIYPYKSFSSTKKIHGIVLNSVDIYDTKFSLQPSFVDFLLESTSNQIVYLYALSPMWLISLSRLVLFRPTSPGSQTTLQ